MAIRKLTYFGLTLLCFVGLAGTIFAYKGYRAASIAMDTKDHLRYLIDSGEEIGDVPASSAFASGYLEAVFGDNPALLEELQKVISKGLSDTSKLNLSRITAMLVTYRLDDDNSVLDVATHIIGSQKEGRRKPGFHRDGYFKNLVDRNLWNSGNTIINFLGKEIVFFAAEETADNQAELIDSLFTGDIGRIVNAIDKPYHYTLVVPNPRRLLPPQLRHHIQTIIVKGMLHQQRGENEMINLCSSPKSAKYTASVLNDMQTASEAILKTKFGGVIKDKPWGPTVETWWAHEMVMASERAIITSEESIVRITTAYGRVMVNVVLKSFERMGRDLRQITGSLNDKKDPRQVDWEMRSPHPRHYWSAPHKWGPNWPIAPIPLEDEEELIAAPLADEEKSL